MAARGRQIVQKSTNAGALLTPSRKEPQQTVITSNLAMIPWDVQDAALGDSDMRLSTVGLPVSRCAPARICDEAGLIQRS